MKKVKDTKVHTLIKTVSVLFFFYLAYCFLLFLLQRQIMFPRYQIRTPEGMRKDFPDIEKIWLNTPCGKVEAWFLPPDPESFTRPSPAIIFAHGNGELIDFWPEEFKGFTHLGIGVLLVEYPGYGRSQGSPSQKSITEAFIAAYDALVARKDIDASRIILLGRSIGGGAVCRLAKERPSAALILMSAFTSARSFASNFLVPGFLVKDPFNNLEVVVSYPGPILVIHGKYDNIIPYRHGVSLYRSAQHGKMITYNCRHNDCPPDWNTFLQDVNAFLHSAGIVDDLK